MRESTREPKREPKLRAAKGDPPRFAPSAFLKGSREQVQQLYQEWLATWHHPRGTFSLLLAFQAPHAVEVTWKTEDTTFTARR
jgi:hypothetical protein